MKNFFQPFHLVTNSPWPLLISLNMFNLTMSMIKMFNFNQINLLMISILLIFLCSYQWWRDVTRESTFQGFHTLFVLNGLKMGMILFIISEIFFFLSFFWSYFHMFLSPSIEIGMMWPPMNLKLSLINPYNLPLLNTIILVSSGMFLSLGHYKILKMKNPFFMIFLTIIFGIIFSLIQIFEYFEAKFLINSSNFGSTFFMMTGFHGIHVFIGTIFIIITLIRMKIKHFSNIHHFSFEASAWYWHFVDVVWLFLFILIYWWPY